MSLKTYFMIAVAAQESPVVPQLPVSEASKDMLARGMALLDGEWSGNETTRTADDAMTTTVETGTFESRMNHENYTATVNNEGQVFHVRLEPGALVYSADGREGEQRREITKFFPVDDDGNWFIAVSHETPLADGKLYTVNEVYRMDDGVCTRTAEAAPADSSGPPTLIRWGSFKKVAER